MLGLLSTIVWWIVTVVSAINSMIPLMHRENKMAADCPIMANTSSHISSHTYKPSYQYSISLTMLIFHTLKVFSSLKYYFSFVLKKWKHHLVKEEAASKIALPLIYLLFKLAVSPVLLLCEYHPIRKELIK